MRGGAVVVGSIAAVLALQWTGVAAINVALDKPLPLVYLAEFASVVCAVLAGLLFYKAARP